MKVWLSFAKTLAWVCSAAVALDTAGCSCVPDAGASRNSVFSEGSFWGVSTSPLQVEGYPPDSNWTRAVGSDTGLDPVGAADDFRHRYKEDIALAKGMGLNVFRIGVDWSRVEPKPGQPDQSELAYYDDLVQSIKDAGMRPMITLDHWVYPGWVADKGGWGSQSIVGDWLANAKRVVDRYQRYDPFWITFNEVLAIPLRSAQTQGLPLDQFPAIFGRVVQAHNEAYDYIHKIAPSARVTSNAVYAGPLEDDFDQMVLDKMRLDYVGIDYYDYPPATNSGKATLADALYAPTAVAQIGGQVNAPWANPFHPEGIYYALRHFARRYPGKPLYVVENGLATDDAKPRADGVTRARQIRDTVYWVQRAKNDGMPVIGYTYWSLMDNYEWGSYRPRFGLYTVDVTTDPTLVRKPTDGVAAYKRIAERRGVPENYLPETALSPCDSVDPAEACADPVHLPGN